MAKNMTKKAPHRIPIAKAAPRWKPFPWSRYSAEDMPRCEALPRCPSAKCRRVKACVDSHKGLYCQRTHFTLAEGRIRTPKSEMDIYIENLKSPPKGAAVGIKLEFLREVQQLREDQNREKMRAWRSGAFSDTYGKYRAGGVLKSPPPRIYAEM